MTIFEKLHNFDVEYTNALIAFQEDPTTRENLEAVEVRFRRWAEQKRDAIRRDRPDDSMLQDFAGELEGWIAKIDQNQLARGTPDTKTDFPGNCVVQKSGEGRYPVFYVDGFGHRQLVRADIVSLDFAYRKAADNLRGGRVWYQDGDVCELYRARTNE